MRWLVRYVVALFPLTIVLLVWLTAEWAYGAFGCTFRGKELLSCYAYGYDITGFLGIGLFWFKLFLLPVAWVVCVTWFVVIAINHLQSFGAAGNPNASFERDA